MGSPFSMPKGTGSPWQHSPCASPWAPPVPAGTQGRRGLPLPCLHCCPHSAQPTLCSQQVLPQPNLVQANPFIHLCTLQIWSQVSQLCRDVKTDNRLLISLISLLETLIKLEVQGPNSSSSYTFCSINKFILWKVTAKIIVVPVIYEGKSQFRTKMIDFLIFTSASWI